VDLKNIEKLVAEKTNEAARANKAKVATALKVAGEYIPRKGKRVNGGGPKKGTPRRAVPPSIANGARLLMGRSQLTTPMSVVGSVRYT